MTIATPPLIATASGAVMALAKKPTCMDPMGCARVYVMPQMPMTRPRYSLGTSE